MTFVKNTANKNYIYKSYWYYKYQIYQVVLIAYYNIMRNILTIYRTEKIEEFSSRYFKFRLLTWHMTELAAVSSPDEFTIAGRGAKVAFIHSRLRQYDRLFKQ